MTFVVNLDQESKNDLCKIRSVRMLS